MAQRNNATPSQRQQQPQFAGNLSTPMFGLPPNVNTSGFDPRTASPLSLLPCESIYDPDVPIYSTRPLEAPQPRGMVILAKLSGGVPIPGETSLQGVHINFATAWKVAEASANAKKAELEEQAILAGYPSPYVMVLTDAFRSTFTIAVDHVFRWRYQVEKVQPDIDIIENRATPKQAFNANFRAEHEAQRKRQDTPAQANTTAEFMQRKHELVGSRSASLADCSTPAPEDHGSFPQPNSTAINMSGVDEVSFEIPPEPTTSDFEGDTVADDDSLFGDLMNQIPDTGVALPDVFSEPTDSLFGGNINQIADTGAALPDVILEPAVTQHIELEPETATGAEAEIQNSNATLPVVPEDQTSTQEAWSGDFEANNAIETPITSAPQINYGTPCFGLYLTHTDPSGPAVTYRLQLNTSLGQADSDMKLIVTNEVVKAQAQGVAEDMKLEIDVHKLEIVNKSGSRLSYEIAEGAFADGNFTSKMERDGRVIDGESYTRTMFENAVRETERIHRQGLESHKHAIDEAKEDLPETPNTEDFEETVVKSPATQDGEETVSVISATTDVLEPSADSPTTEDEESDADADGQETSVNPPATDDGEESDVSSPSEAPPSRKRTRSPSEEVPATSPAQDQDASTEEAAPTTPPSKKRKVESPRASRIESHDKTPEQQHPTPIALHSPIKKRGRESEESTTRRPSSTAAEEPPSKKKRMTPTEHVDAATEESTQATAATPAADEPTEDTAIPADELTDDIYCRCKQPDDGTNMLGCDGAACRNNGWVHIGCFPEIEAPPVDDGGESKWYCPDCDPAAFEPKKKVAKKGQAVTKGKAVKKGGVSKKKTSAAANKRRLIR
ncbi:hypothetical protein P171DRAFT_511544 [Karstenula rhodostoma CBS 690.94]|uniref:Zinc finger PHD-type domain-containing protein n=1 Tax=Karstenula rhodostoma CBS 690.94 TaxID=1392251 RepID=A0A9P4PNN8_9PLEO|nr:hypothetical protein P171DRAFT_511544 [Karstenula rhodostoma CBS 690.94]